MLRRSRIGGAGLGTVAMIGLAVLVFVFGLPPSSPPVTVLAIIVADDDRVEQDGNFRTLTGGINYYFFPGSHALKLTGNLIWFLDEEASSLAPTSTNTGLLPSADDGQWAVQIQIQAIF